ncbi:MAG: tetratricopeptide repeat protein [Candidatus Poribacteria bacterium]
MIKKLLICATIFAFALTALRSQTPLQEDYGAIQTAHDFYYDKKYAKALSAYTDLLESPLQTNTKDLIRLNIGRCYSELGDDVSAIQSFRALIDEKPDDSYSTQAVYQIANLYANRYQYGEATQACRKLSEKYPDTKTASIAGYLTAQYLYYDQRYDEAIKCYHDYLNNYSSSPYRVSVIQTLIRIYRSRQEYKEAEKLIRDQLAINPSDTNLFEQLADLYKSQGRRKEALSLYQSVLEKNPGDTDLLKKLGELYAESGQKDLAIEQWSKITSSGSNQYYRYQKLGQVYLSNQMYDKAVDAYETALEINPKNSYLYTQLANVYKIQGKIEKVVDTHLQALSIIDIGYAGRGEIIPELAEIYEGNQRRQLLNNIIHRIEVMLQQNPQNAKMVLALAEIHFHQADYEASLRNFRRLSNLYSADQGRQLEKHAQILEREGIFSATQFYQAIAEFYPSSHLKRSAQVKLAQLYKKAKRWKEAIAVLRQISPSDSSTQVLLGKIYLDGLHNLDIAEGIFQQLSSQQLFPNLRQQVNLLIAECYILRGRSTAAQSILGPLVKKPGDFQLPAQKLIGDSYLFKAEFDKAVSHYKKVLEISVSDPSSNDALDLIALIQSNGDFNKLPLKSYVGAVAANRRGEIGAAIQICQGVIQEFSNSFIVDDAWWLIAQIQERQKAYTKAIETLQNIIEGSQSLIVPEAQAKIADLYLLKNEPELAIQNYTSLVADYPDSVMANYARQQIDLLGKNQPVVE